MKIPPFHSVLLRFTYIFIILIGVLFPDAEMENNLAEKISDSEERKNQKYIK